MLAPVIFISTLLYLATAGNGHGWKLYDFVSKKISGAGAGQNHADPAAIARAGLNPSAVMNPARHEQASTPRLFYKWRDENNTIIISTGSPPAGIHAETYYFQTQNNASLDAPPAHSAAGEQHRSSSSVSLADSPIKVYTPDGLRRLIHYSREIGDRIEIRGRELSDLVEQLQER